MTPPSQPFAVFSWLAVDSASMSAGSRWLAIYPPAAAEMSARIGVRAWRVLETMALHSWPHPEHGYRSTYQGTVDQLLALARGGDTQSGWGDDTMRPILASLRDAGFYTFFPGKRLGRGKGQKESLYVLSESLFFRIPMPSSPNAADPYSSEPYPFGSVPALEPPPKDPEQFAAVPSALPHGDGMNDIHGATTHLPDSDAVQRAVIETLRGWGWTTNIDTVITDHGLARVAQHIITLSAESGVSNPGALLRKRLADGFTPAPPPGCTDGAADVIYLEHGTLRWVSQQAYATKDLPRVNELIERLESLSPADAETIKRHGAEAKKLNPDNPTMAWREIVARELRERQTAL